MTFDEAKQQVAEKHEYRDWKHMEEAHGRARNLRGLDRFYREVAELMAQSAANEAVREDRWKVIERLSGTDYGLDPSEHPLILDLPLPFPDAK